MAVPVVAIVGRPNVGKSSLFNWLAGKRIAIVDPTAGVTRDRVATLIKTQDRFFELVDTGGLLLGSDDPLLGPASVQAERAIDEADRVVLVVDARAGLLPDDSAIASRLRRKGKDVVVAVNFGDSTVSVELDRPHVVRWATPSGGSVSGATLTLPPHAGVILLPLP